MSEFVQVKNIFSNVLNPFPLDIIRLITSYLILLVKKIELKEEISELFLYQNKICLTISGRFCLLQIDLFKVICLTASNHYCLLQINYFKSVQKIVNDNEIYLNSLRHSNWFYDTIHDRHTRETKDDILSIEKGGKVNYKEKNTNEEKKFICNFSPNQVYLYTLNNSKEKTIICSVSCHPHCSRQHFYFIDDQNKITKLSQLSSKSWKSWCVWKNLLLTQDKENKIQMYDVETSRILHNNFSDLFLTSPSKLLPVLDYLYVTNGTILYIYEGGYKV